MRHDKLYQELIRQYNADNWQTVCGLDRFLKIQAEKALNRLNIGLYNAILSVIAIAENDY